ncbi:MAG: queuosine precursor transporter [Halanaerobiales bacterium]|nr:queuosine precursor transporter [Halanaerobiales bacterium]
MNSQEKSFSFLSTLFVILIVISNIVASKIITIGGMFVPAAVVFYAITFALTDTISEVWGKERCKFVVKMGLGVSLLTAILIKVAILLPPAPFYQNQDSYALILGGSIRITSAGLIAYIISQFHDIWAFAFWNKITKGKQLWLRNNASTLVSQLIDTVIFITLAFYGTGMPIVNMIVSQYIIKAIIAILDTPVVYLLVSLFKKENKNVRCTV